MLKTKYSQHSQAFSFIKTHVDLALAKIRWVSKGHYCRTPPLTLIRKNQHGPTLLVPDVIFKDSPFRAPRNITKICPCPVTLNCHITPRVFYVVITSQSAFHILSCSLYESY